MRNDNDLVAKCSNNDKMKTIMQR